MGKHEDVTNFRARADEWADEFLLKLPQPVSPGASTLARDALRLGWMVGYNTAICDGAIIQSAEGSVKH